MRAFGMFALAGVFMFGACSRIDELRYGEVRQITIYESRVHAAFSGITRLKSGELLIVFREGNEPVSPDGKILMCLSKDGGRTWTPPDTIVSTSWDCRDPSVVQLRDGLIVVNFFQSMYNDQGELIGTVGCFTVRSFDNGKTFTAPRMVQIPGVDWAGTSDAILELSDGSLLLPAYGGKREEGSVALAVISRDGGETWKESYIIAEDSGNRIHYQEPAFVQLPDGRICCMLRTTGADGFLYQAVSEDGGKTWSSPKSSGVQGEAPDLHLTPDGTLLFAYRDFWPRGVSFVRSYDWGRTWEREAQLFSADDDCGCPNIVTLDDGFLAVHYAVFRRGGEKSDAKSGILGTLFSIRKPGTPKGFSASVRGENRVSLRWNSVEDAVYYVVYRDTVQDFDPQPGYPFEGNGIASPTSIQYTDVRVNPGKTYYYRVSAVAGMGELISGTGGESEPTEVVEVDIR